uniref:Reticulon n=1 Tax=Myripristis murdjan TaxID=586833 RepID=A0A668AA38_9TELE
GRESLSFIPQYVNSQYVASRETDRESSVLSPPSFSLPFGIHRCLLVESKDGRHHYAAHSSTAKIRAGRQAGGQAGGLREEEKATQGTLAVIDSPARAQNLPECAGSVLLPLWHAAFRAIDLLYWRNVKQSGAVFGSVLLLLFSLTQFSVVSVGAYLALAALSATISFRIYKSVLQAVQKTDEGHPFKAYLEVEIALSQDQISKYADKILLYTNTCMKELRRLFLVQDLVDSLKFAVLMWLLTYVGALFNGLTLLILAVVSMFTMPVVYEKHQAQIDQYVGLIRTQVNSVVGKIQAKIPGAKRKEE